MTPQPPQLCLSYSFCLLLFSCPLKIYWTATVLSSGEVFTGTLMTYMTFRLQLVTLDVGAADTYRITLVSSYNLLPELRNW